MQQPLGAAYEGVTTFVEAKGLVGSMSDPDANRCGDLRFGRASLLACFGRNQHAQPNRPARKEIKAIEASVDPQRRGKAPRAAREIEKLHAFSVALHQLDSFKWLKRANQNSSANASPFAGNIQHKVHAVIEIDVHVPVPQKK
jgi:hypothetical protein